MITVGHGGSVATKEEKAADMEVAAQHDPRTPVVNSTARQVRGFTAFWNAPERS